MSNKTVEAHSKTERPHAGLEIVGQLTEYLLAVMMVVLCTVVPLYAKDGYHQIGNAKYDAYRNIMMFGCSILLVMMVAYIICWVAEHKKPSMSATDGCVLAYLILTGISVISGGFYGDAKWGHSGWNMGFMSQLSFVLLYLFLSRFGRYYRLMLTVLCGSACVVYVIGILHRLLIDPIGFYDGLTDTQKAQFLSTLGQATWYASFLSVTLPIGIGVFLYTDRKMWRALGGIFMALGFCTLVTQNSDSAYFGLAGALLIFLMISARGQDTMCRYMGALTLLFASGKVMYFLMQIHPNPKLEVDFITSLMWTSGVTWGLLIFCLVMTILLYVMGNKFGPRKYPEFFMTRICRLIPAAAIVLILGAVLLIALQTRGVLPAFVTSRLENISYFNWNNEWGNGRGRIWSFSVKLFAEANIVHKLFGVGPDCFYRYVSVFYRSESALLWGDKQLTNAHNEWLNMLINVGILGAAAYLGIYVTAIRRFFREHRRNILLAGITAACVSYMCYNFFCYQQVLCTPFIFLLIGIGEYIFRELSREENRIG